VANAADPRIVLPAMAASVLPYWIGVMVFVGVLGASMSTANGAILVISVVLARNVIQRHRTAAIDDGTMLRLSRLMALPVAAAAGLVAYLRPEPGILLILAFDIVFAGCVVPLIAGLYWDKATSAGAIASVVVGTSVRLIAHFVTPAAWSGLDTLVPPLIGAVAFYLTCQMTATPATGRDAVIAGIAREGVQA
jgi:solute:Na+ symporter, SSS family